MSKSGNSGEESNLKNGLYIQKKRYSYKFIAISYRILANIYKFYLIVSEKFSFLAFSPARLDAFAEARLDDNIEENNQQ